MSARRGADAAAEVMGIGRNRKHRTLKTCNQIVPFVHEFKHTAVPVR